MDVEPSLRLKTTETLLGIETSTSLASSPSMPCLKTTETLLGIETHQIRFNITNQSCLKTTETLLGIETPHTTDISST